MRTVGLIFLPSESQASLIAGGITVFERQARQLHRAGIETIFAMDVVPLTILPLGVTAVTAAQVLAHIAVDDRVVVLAPGLIIDERAITAILAAPLPAMFVDPAQGVERLDASGFATGLMALRGALVQSVAARLGEWDMGSTLIRAAAVDTATNRIPFEKLPIYAPARRRDVPIIWVRPQSEAEARVATDILIAAAQKGCLDWPARFIHPWPEDLLVRLLAPTPVTPNMVTAATGVIGIIAAIAFAMGWLWTGLILALITGPLDGVDGKLARTRVEFSKWGDLEHLVDKLLEYGWYLCIAWFFAGQRYSALPWAIAALIILPAIAEAVQGEFFRRLTGVQLDDAGIAERRIRLIAGRRNTFLWTFAGFAVAGLWFEGFVALAAYSVVTTGVAQWRFYKRLSRYARDHGQRIAANYAATGYTFLPKAGL